MNISDYQYFVSISSFFPKSTKGRNLSYLVMGIVEEIGEIYEYILKKEKLKEEEENITQQIVKDLGDLDLYISPMCNKNELSMEKLKVKNKYITQQIVKELGDVIWYITALCIEMDLSLEQLMEVKCDNNDIDNNSLFLYISYLSGAIKKMIRDDNEKITEERGNKIITNLSYVLVYVLQLCDKNNVSFENVLEINVNKILSRSKRGTLRGSGDDR